MRFILVLWVNVQIAQFESISKLFIGTTLYGRMSVHLRIGQL